MTGLSDVHTGREGVLPWFFVQILCTFSMQFTVKCRLGICLSAVQPVHMEGGSDTKKIV